MDKKIEKRESDRAIIRSISQCRRQILFENAPLLNNNIKLRIIIWDEGLMTHTYKILAICRLLKDITNNDNFFGGKIVIFCDDPRQTS